MPLLSLTIVAALLAPPAVPPGLPFHEIRLSCKQVSSCEEAVALWCNGYAKADGDNDGIPCENVCFSLIQVEQAKASLGC